jgi:hypothetical protein
MWDYTHKTISMDALKTQDYTQETIEVYNSTSTIRKNLKAATEKLASLTIPFGTEVYANSVAIVKALIIAGLEFNKNTTYKDIKD